MDSSCGNNSFSFRDLVFARVEVGHYQQLYGVPSTCFCQLCLSDDIILRLIDILLEKLPEICIGIWEPMGNKDLVIIVAYLEVEAKGIRRVGFTCSWVIDDVITCSVPSLTCLITSLFRVKEDLHPLVIVRIVLTKVRDVESIRGSNFSICEFEEEPLCVALGVIVGPHMQLILVFAHFDDLFQISRFKSRFKHQSRVLRISQHIVGIQLCEILVKFWCLPKPLCTHPSRPIIIIGVVVR